MRKYTAKQPGRHLSLGVGVGQFRIYDSLHLEVGQTIEQPPGTYILLIVSEPEIDTILDRPKDIEPHPFEAYSAAHLVDYCRHCARTREEH